MPSPRTRRVATLGAVLAIVAAGCGGARPYRLMAKTAASEENVHAQAEDHRLTMHIREALLADGPGQALDVTPYAYMGHAYLVGFVDRAGDAERLASLVRRVDGVRSVDTYLPERPAGDGASRKARDLEVKARVKGAIATEPGEVVMRVEIESLDGHVVLLGVVRDEEAVADAGAAASGIAGAAGVTNFLLVPETEYESLRPRLR